MRRSDLPFGSEFSPSQIDLQVLLELAHEHGADWRAFEAAGRDRCFSTHETSDDNKAKLANNTKLSLRAYGLIDERDAMPCASAMEHVGRHTWRACRRRHSRT